MDFADQHSKYLMHISSLSIFNCLGCDEVHLKFSESNVQFVLYRLAENSHNTQASNVTMAMTPVMYALKLMCTSNYATAESLATIPQLEIGQGRVEMTFEIERIAPETEESTSEEELDMEPSTSKQAMAKELERLKRKQNRQGRRAKRRSKPSRKIYVVRRFEMIFDLEWVTYQVNGGSFRQMSIQDFHKKFFVPEQHSMDHLINLQRTYAGNFLKLINADMDAYREFKTDVNPFDKFIDIFLRSQEQQNELLYKLTTNCLSVIESARLVERHFVLKVFREVHRIFEYITADEYTVMFYVPRLDGYRPLSVLSVEDFDLSNVRTYIKVCHVDDVILWSHADHNIMDILLISFQLALASIGNQPILFLGQLDKLNEFVCHQYATAFFMNTLIGNENPYGPKWICTRYLQSIMELGNSMGLIIFVEYPSGLTLLPDNHSVIKCKQYRKETSGQLCWKLYEDVVKDENQYLLQFQEMFN
ncbi:protein ORD [Drosophila tropicalis]|uniref:protein ORD n=1 Tax=Drosophila tropicalis TaxID=46794 RepID=UPI0035ABF425